MKNKQESTDKMKDEDRAILEEKYKKIMRFVEYYVLLCFILITFVPLLEFSWVPAVTRFIYMTGFPLLILLFLVSLFKEPLLDVLARL